MLFLRKEEILAAHARAIKEFGGLPGLRDEGLLDSALIAPAHRQHYEGADLATCAATYAYHLTQAHAFVDGNKRVAAAAAEAFVQMNGGRVVATNEQIVALFLRIAAGTASREEVVAAFAQWVTTCG
jgi:death-on-curing protein